MYSGSLRASCSFTISSTMERGSSTGASRVLPRCWLYCRHQASTMPMLPLAAPAPSAPSHHSRMLSGLRRSHTPSSLWTWWIGVKSLLKFLPVMGKEVAKDSVIVIFFFTSFLSKLNTIDVARCWLYYRHHASTILMLPPAAPGPPPPPPHITPTCSLGSGGAKRCRHCEPELSSLFSSLLSKKKIK